MWGLDWLACRAADVAWRAAELADRGAAGWAAWAAGWSGAFALVVRDLIAEEHFNTLYGPWASVMEA